MCPVCISFACRFGLWSRRVVVVFVCVVASSRFEVCEVDFSVSRCHRMCKTYYGNLPIPSIEGILRLVLFVLLSRRS